jgi:uncharacterized protein
MHVVVTGASSGIGAAIARRFSQAGAAVTLVARRAAELEVVAASLATRCHIVVHDLSVPEHAAVWLDSAVAELGPVDVLCNNAGAQVIGATGRLDVDEGERSLRLNLLTPLRLTRAVLPAMLARGAGTVVDVASMAALAPTPGMTYYNAGKGGLAAASEALRGELLGTGVHVVTVYPGIIPDTDMAQKGLVAYEAGRALALQPRGTAAGLADRIVRAVERRKARVIYPRMNALARWFPGTTRWVMDRFTPPLR